MAFMMVKMALVAQVLFTAMVRIYLWASSGSDSA